MQKVKKTALIFPFASLLNASNSPGRKAGDSSSTLKQIHSHAEAQRKKSNRKITISRQAKSNRLRCGSNQTR
jgi:hypothetical protein